VKWITRFYRNYHSSRYVQERLVIRLHHVPSPSAIKALNEDFEDVITGPPIEVIEPTPEEREDNDCLHLPRIAFGFDRKSFGRLRELIDRLNCL
ncbi:MAG: cytochrome D ubiquinol oxidase subunit II, partial [Verrucomicrobiae bacterium]|nr:cytochrome D ubiquinol oxidase subunit II [Verrucomicrobiae bacterium]